MKLKWLYTLIANNTVWDANFHIHNERENSYICITTIEPSKHTHGHVINVDGIDINQLLDKITVLLDDYTEKHEIKE